MIPTFFSAIPFPRAPALESVKPRLYRHNGTWFCRKGHDLGFGVTPLDAFRCWLAESLMRYDFD